MNTTDEKETLLMVLPLVLLGLHVGCWWCAGTLPLGDLFVTGWLWVAVKTLCYSLLLI